MMEASWEEGYNEGSDAVAHLRVDEEQGAAEVADEEALAWREAAAEVNADAVSHRQLPHRSDCGLFQRLR